MDTIYILGAVAVFISAFGIEGRGLLSGKIANIGSWLWLLSVIYVFYSTSIKTGFLYIFGTFLLGALFRKILRPLLNPRGH